MATASASASMAVAKRSLDSSLMPPPPQSKRIKRPAKVLDEDDYNDALSHIIARDFFPGLLETETKQRYLDALDSKDPQWIAAAGQTLNEIMTPGPDGRRLRGRRGTSLSTPILRGCKDNPNAWQVDTPSSTGRTPMSSAQPEKPVVDTNISLEAFQQKYTTEDNESFYRLLDKQNQKRAERYAWMWSGNKIPAARQIAYRKREQIMADEKSVEKAENGKELAVVEAGDTRKAMPDTWHSGPRNGFMFTPDSVEDSMQTVAQENVAASTAPPRAVNYDNTRVSQDHTIMSIDRPPSPTLSAVKEAIAGRPRLMVSEVSFNGASTPRVNGYSFVDSEEPERPSSPPESSAKLWLENGDSTPSPFKLGESSKREALHHRMVDRISKSKRSTKGTRKSELKAQATPKFLSSPRIIKKETLTPAAEKLLGKVGKTPLTISGGVWDSKEKTPRRSGLRSVLTPRGNNKT